MIKIGLHSGGCLRVSDRGRIDAADLTLEDIAFGLSHVTRFGGQAGPYSVGRHSIIGAETYPDAAPWLRRAFLLHDAPEALGVGDVNRFVKRRYAKSLRRFDNRLTKVIWSAFGRSKRPWKEVHRLIAPWDRVVGAAECLYFGFPSDGELLQCHPESVDAILECLYDNPTAGSAQEWLTAWEDACSSRGSSSGA